MYIIIGGDQKEYGPITADDVRKWITEGRLNAQSQVKAESDAEWRPLSAFPEFAHAFAARAAAAGAPPMVAPSTDWLGRDYELDIGGCISRSFELLKSNFGLLFVGVLIYLLIEGAVVVLGMIPLIGTLISIANLFIVGPLMGGVFYLFIQAIRHQPAGVGDVFAGFRKAFLHLFLGYLVPALLGGLCLIPVVITAFLTVLPSVMRHQPVAATGMLILVPVSLVCLIALIYLQVNWVFTFPLIIDKQMDFWSAMKASWRMVGKHWWQVFGLVVLVSLLNVAGLLACCVGVLFSMPIGLGALMYAYETIFSESQGS